MNASDREDAVARALDLLPDGDPARSDPRMLRHPGLVDEARAARETAADVWLAVSPLRAAPPDVLEGVMKKIRPPRETEDGLPKRWVWLAAAGWAAAMVLGIAWWLGGKSSVEEIVTNDDPAPFRRAQADLSPRGRSSAPEVEQDPMARKRQVREELVRLRNGLAADRSRESGFRPRIIGMKSPSAKARTPEEDRERLLGILAGALRATLEAESGAPNDPASLVIERGWPVAGMLAETGGEVIRHRNFPEHSWEALGLLRSADGRYHDPSSGMIWTPDEEGRGFFGRQAEEEDDLTVFHEELPKEKKPGAEERNSEELAMPQAEPELRLQSEPEGFVIEDPVSGETQVVIEGVPPPGEGNVQILVWTDFHGQRWEQPWATPAFFAGEGLQAFGGNAGIPANFLMGDMGGLWFGNNVISLPIGNTGLRSIQLIEQSVSTDGGPGIVILDGGE